MTDAFSASSSTAADPTTSGSCDYSRHDVFINHRGPDTKKTFASYLYHRLLSHGFTVFLDLEELEEGLPFPSQIEGAIQTASVHVAVFSSTYAESPWCLKELLLMLKSGAPIIPVFYHVEPSELRWTQNKNGLYGKALHDLQMKKTKDPQTDMTVPRYDPATIQNWRNVLSSVADISGFDLDNKFNGDEGQLLDQVVKRVVEIMATKRPLYVAKYPTGLDDKVEDFERVVKQQHTRKVKVVGIVGLGGMGKTTLALEFFNRKRAEYKTSHFLSDVRENAKSSVHLLQLQRELHKGLTKSDQRIDNIHQGTKMLKEFLSSPSSRFLIILDDVDHEEQVDSLLPNRDNYCSNSLILITSRDRDILRKSGVEETSIYKLTGLPLQHSRKLFCSYAFCQAYPLLGFEDLVDKFLKACQGLPLSLKVFGALFLGKNDKYYWQEILSRVYEVPDDIHKILKITFDALHEKEQQIFLDIACFFLGRKRDITVVGIWDEPGWKGSSRFQNLESKCLVEVDSNNYIHMHGHLRDLGREIALNKLPRRLWHPENIYNLLEQSSGLTEVRTMMIFLNNDTYSDSNNVTLSLRKMSPELFENCLMSLHNIFYRFLGIGVKKLQLLDTEGDLLEFILRRVHSPNLVWLYWRDCPYSYLPSWLPMQNLRVLRVEGKLLKTLWQDRSQALFQSRGLEIFGNLLKPEEFCKMWLLEVLVLERCSELKALPDSFGNLPSLQHMELSGCKGLQRLPESFGNLPSLQYMKLSECKGLQRLPETFGNLPNLQYMELSGCNGLQRLPESFGKLRSLQHMQLSWCGSLERLSESFGNMPSLQYMKLSGCGSLERLPESFGNLPSLEHMELSECKGLQRLPETFGNLPNLQYMELSGCKGLQRLPESFGDLPSLQHMKLSECKGLQRLPETFGNLPNLQYMELSGCKGLQRLPESFGDLPSLQHMELSQCWGLWRLPESFGNLPSLQHMNLSQCWDLQRLPESFGKLRSLQHMQLSWCESLERLSESFGNMPSLQYMELSGWSLERLPESFGNLPSLEHMKLFECLSLQSLSDSFGNLRSLQHMELSGCGSLKRLPESFGNLWSLQRMELSGCGSLQTLPESFGNLSSLERMKLYGCESLQRLPETFGNLPNLQYMELSGCKGLQRLPESFGNLSSLERMKLCRCESLQRLPETFGNLLNLQYMGLSGCKGLQRLPESFGNLWSLERMELSGCRSLQRLPESFGNLLSLQRMELSGCWSLQRLPESFGNLSSLQHMQLSRCGSLETLPQSFCNLSNLQVMELSRYGCRFLERLSESFGNLRSLERMQMFGCGSLEPLPGKWICWDVGVCRDCQVIKHWYYWKSCGHQIVSS